MEAGGFCEAGGRVEVDSWENFRGGNRLEFFLRCLDCGAILSGVYADERECAASVGRVTHECKGAELGAA
jgi:hypothetical protein